MSWWREVVERLELVVCFEQRLWRLELGRERWWRLAAGGERWWRL